MKAEEWLYSQGYDIDAIIFEQHVTKEHKIVDILPGLTKVLEAYAKHYALEILKLDEDDLYQSVGSIGPKHMSGATHQVIGAKTIIDKLIKQIEG